MSRIVTLTKIVTRISIRIAERLPRFLTAPGNSGAATFSFFDVIKCTMGSLGIALFVSPLYICLPFFTSAFLALHLFARLVCSLGGSNDALGLASAARLRGNDKQRNEILMKYLSARPFFAGVSPPTPRVSKKKPPRERRRGSSSTEE